MKNCHSSSSFFFFLVPSCLAWLAYLEDSRQFIKQYIDGIMPKGQMCQNEIFQVSSSKLFDCFAVCYYHVSLKLPEITKCYSIWKACCFRWYHLFSKIFIHIDITVHRPFWSWCLCPFVLHHLWRVHPATMVRYTINVSHLLYFGTYIQLNW